MSNPTIVFTSAGRRVELLKLFRASFDKLGVQGRIVACDIDPLAPALVMADEAVIVPRTSHPNFVTSLITVCGQQPETIVIPLTDPDLRLLAAARAQFIEAGVRLVLCDTPAIEIAADKWRTTELFRELDVPIPASWNSLDSVASNVAYPLIVKPRFGSAAQNVFRVRDRTELEFFSRYVDAPIIQECLSGHEITTDILCNQQGEMIGYVSRKRLQTRAGEIARGVTIHDERVAHYCRRIADSSKARGPINVQCFVDDHGPRFTEINARFGGGTPLAVAAGFDEPTLLIADLLGIQPPQPHVSGEYARDLFLTRYDESLFIDAETLERLASRHF